jgi:hypothetical protein
MFPLSKSDNSFADTISGLNMGYPQLPILEPHVPYEDLPSLGEQNHHFWIDLIISSWLDIILYPLYIITYNYISPEVGLPTPSESSQERAPSRKKNWTRRVLRLFSMMIIFNSRAAFFCSFAVTWHTSALGRCVSLSHDMHRKLRTWVCYSGDVFSALKIGPKDMFGFRKEYQIP